MTDWVDSFRGALEKAKTLDDLTAQIVGLRDRLNVDHVVYHSVNSAGGQYGALTYDEAWVSRYIAEDYARIDPVVQGCYRSFEAVDWRTLDWSGRTRRSFMAEALEAGVGEQGLSVPLRGPSGHFAMFSVSGQTSDAAWDTFREERLPTLLLLAHYVNRKALEIERGEQTSVVAPLSPRETDTLRMLALGKSRAQAAHEMTISEHTLRAYIENARMKLGALNTTHAIARAMSHGLLVV